MTMAGKRILIVEDEVALEGRPLEMKLTRAGFEVVGIAKTENEAVEMARRKDPTIVLMDISLPDTNGKKDHFAGIRAARQIQASTRAQIIFVTVLGCDKRVIAEAQKVPGCQFLAKPVAKRQLLASVQFAVAKAQRKDLIFVCYSHEDSFFAEEMMEHLGALSGLGTCAWIDTQIAPSQRWKVEINRALAEAKAAIFLVSSGFIASEFVTKVELPALLEAEVERGLCVYPVFVNFVHEVILKPMGLLDFQGINRPDDPIASWRRPRRHKECWGVLCKWVAS